MIQLIVELALVSVLLHRGAATWALPNCTKSCGNLTYIPYPFGIEPGCFLNEWYEIECRPQKGNVLFPFLKKLDSEVLTIFTEYLNYAPPSYIEVMLPMTVNWEGESCRANAPRYRPKNQAVSLQGSPFFFSSMLNSFFMVGCNTMGMVEHPKTGEFSGCTSKCQDFEGVTGFTTKGSPSRYSNCSSGINCCDSSIPTGLQNFSVLFMKQEGEDIPPCSYALMFNSSRFHTNRIDLHAIRTLDKVPVVLGWGVVTDLSNANDSKNFCPNSGCYESSEIEQSLQQDQTRLVCICHAGYEGNPYIENGCQDIDECKTGQHDCHTGTCVNRPGDYDCVVNQKMHFVIIGSGVGLGLLVVILFLWWIYKITMKRKERKLKVKYFQQNGGLLLQQRLYSINNNLEKSKLFSSRELEIATGHFDANRILGQGGGGTVYKGILPNGEIVAIKRSKITDAEQVEQFINEIMILSQINHRNIVKLLGCCLETEIPLLVYEFISNGTLHNHIHTCDEENPISWEMRLQIAIDVANALSYMHSTTLAPIYHRDIKSSNILLDEKYRAKVADFGISRLVSLEQTHLTTLVQGTFGYLDPEYFQSSQYTDKSDVYSFGMVLVELLTGQKPISSLRERQGKCLATYFVHSIEDSLLFEVIDPYILNHARVEEISKVGNLAYRCLDLNGSKRPTMKEVKMELEVMKRHEDLYNNVGEEKPLDEAIEPVDANSSQSSFRGNVDQSYDIHLLAWSHSS